MNTRNPHRRRASRDAFSFGTRHSAVGISRSGFTLTEVLIALALVAVLLIGITRIFSITSQTIGTGQALSKAVRTQKAIQQALSSDVEGYLGAGAGEHLTGILSLVPDSTGGGAAPFLAISNFRVPAYKSAAVARSALNAPTPAQTSFNQRSPLIRQVDVNGNGLIDSVTTSIAQGGEIVPLYIYGDRVWRADTFSFFSRGHFESVTGSDANNSTANLTSGETENTAWVWYGHLRIFNSNAASLDHSIAYGPPGYYQSVNRDYVGGPNDPPEVSPNNLYSEQFRLGRVTLLMSNMVDHDGNVSTSPTVVASGDPSKPVVFISRNWNEPYDLVPNRQATPFNLDATARKFIRPASPTGTADVQRDNEVIDLLDRCPAQTSGPFLTFRTCRTDVGSADIGTMRDRVRAVQQYDADPTGKSGLFASHTAVTYSGGSNEWWRYLPVGWNQRFNANPFPGVSSSGYSSKTMAQRQQIVADSVPQFIVEYAGDFIRQDPVTGDIQSAADAMRPDGVTDFVIVNGRRQTRWYGLPRDVDEDGIISGTDAAGNSVTRPYEVEGAGNFTMPAGGPVPTLPSAAASLRMRTSPDVVPLRDVTGYFHAFEKAAPPPASDYGKVLTEPTTSPNRSLDASNPSPEYTGYICLWAPLETDAPVAGKTPGPLATATDVSVYAVPQMVRVIVDVADDTGKLAEPVRMEKVFAILPAK